MAKITEKKSVPKYELSNYKEVKITLKLSTGETVRGCIMINKNTRTSDFFKIDRTSFLTLYKIQHKSIKSGVMFIHKDHIIYAVPTDD